MKVLGYFAAAAVSVAAAQVAEATCWNLTFNGFACGQNVALRYDNSVLTPNGQSSNNFSDIFSGQLKFSGLGNNFKNYCVQLFEGTGPVGSTHEWCVAAVADVPDAPPSPGPMGAVIASLVQDLYAKFHASVQAQNDDVQCAAFQVVLWELTHENFTPGGVNVVLSEVDLHAGAFSIKDFAANDLVYAAANFMLGQLDGSQSLGGNLFGLTSGQWQDQLVVVPIPAPVLLAGLGLLGVAVLRRRVK